jgi:rhodanese-related sulfurtransferase
MRSETVNGAVLEHWTPEEVATALADRSIVLIDVRNPAEFLAERIPGALLAPLPELDPSALPPEGARRLVLHCGAGMRSRKAAELCLAAGMTRIAHLDGGMAAWKADGRDWLRADPATGVVGHAR